MERPLKTIADVQRLLRTGELISNSINTVIDEWAKEAEGNDPTTKILPSQQLYQAQRTIAAAVGTLTELVAEPYLRLAEVTCQYWESRALFIAVERRIADILAEASSNEQRGLHLSELAKRTGVEEVKLGQVLRCLTSAHIFSEIRPDVFANNPTSARLVGNEQFRAYVQLWSLDFFTTCDHLPSHLLGPQGRSRAVDETPFQPAVGTTKSRWEWLEEKVEADKLTGGLGYPGMPDQHQAKDVCVQATRTDRIEETPASETYEHDHDSQDCKPTNGNLDPAAEKPSVTLESRPESVIFGLAMVGAGKHLGQAVLYDYPWAELGEATIVDVGGGMGGFSLQLGKLYPQLKFIVQDRGPVLEQAKSEVWAKESPESLAEKRVTFMPHDFFTANPVLGADVYWLRYITHDWSDEYCVRILQGLKPALTSPRSRILVCDTVVNTTVGCDELTSAPFPLLANYGNGNRYRHFRDLCMLGTTNGIERTPGQFRAIIEAAGLHLSRIYECRGHVSIIEIRNSI